MIVADQPRRFQVQEPGSFEWHGEETHPVYGAFRWSGPAARASLPLPVRLDRPLMVRIHALSAIDAEAMSSIKVFAQDDEMAFDDATTPEETHVLSFSVLPAQAKDAHDHLDLAVAVSRARRPLDLGINGDRRWLGLAWLGRELGGGRASASMNNLSLPERFRLLSAHKGGS